MTNEQYGRALGCIFGAIPGSIGFYGVLAGLSQGRAGPVIVGAILVAVGVFCSRLFVRIVK